jgi:hypothetical protein
MIRSARGSRRRRPFGRVESSGAHQAGIRARRTRSRRLGAAGPRTLRPPAPTSCAQGRAAARPRRRPSGAVAPKHRRLVPRDHEVGVPGAPSATTALSRFQSWSCWPVKLFQHARRADVGAIESGAGQPIVGRSTVVPFVGFFAAGTSAPRVGPLGDPTVGEARTTSLPTRFRAGRGARARRERQAAGSWPLAPKLDGPSVHFAPSV